MQTPISQTVAVTPDEVLRVLTLAMAMAHAPVLQAGLESPEENRKIMPPLNSGLNFYDGAIYAAGLIHGLIAAAPAEPELKLIAVINGLISLTMGAEAANNELLKSMEGAANEHVH